MNDRLHGSCEKCGVYIPKEFPCYIEIDEVTKRLKLLCTKCEEVMKERENRDACI